MLCLVNLDSIPVTKVNAAAEKEHATGMRRAASYQPPSVLSQALESPIVVDRKGGLVQEYVRPKRVSTSTGHQRPILPDSLKSVQMGMQQSGFIPLVREDGSSSTTPPNAVLPGHSTSVSVPKRLVPLPGAVPFLSEPQTTLLTDANSSTVGAVFEHSRSTPGTSSRGTNRSRRSRTSSVSEEARVQHHPELVMQTTHHHLQPHHLQQQLAQLAITQQKDANALANAQLGTPPNTSQPGSQSSNSNQNNSRQASDRLANPSERAPSSEELLALMGCPALQTPPSSDPASPAVSSILSTDHLLKTPSDKGAGSASTGIDSDSSSMCSTPVSGMHPGAITVATNSSNDVISPLDSPALPAHMKQKMGLASSAPAASNFPTITVSTVTTKTSAMEDELASETVTRPPEKGNTANVATAVSASNDAVSFSNASESSNMANGTTTQESPAAIAAAAAAQEKSNSNDLLVSNGAATSTNSMGGANVSNTSISTSGTTLIHAPGSLGASWDERTDSESMFSSSSDFIDEYSDDDDLGYIRVGATSANSRLLVQHLSVFGLDDDLDDDDDISSTDSDDSISSEEVGRISDDDNSECSSDEERGKVSVVKKKLASSSSGETHPGGSGAQGNAKGSSTNDAITKSASGGAAGALAIAGSSSSSVTSSLGTAGASAMFHMDDLRAGSGGLQKKRGKGARWGPTRWINKPLPADGPLPYLKLPSLTSPSSNEGDQSGSSQQGSVATAHVVPDFSVVNVRQSRHDAGVALEYFNMKIVYDSHKTGFEATHDFPIRIGDIIAGRYEIVEYLGSAAFSRAVKCVDHLKGTAVCLKIIKNNKDYFDQSLDEIKLLTIIKNACAGRCDDFHVLELYDYFYFKEHLFLVCELLRENLYEVYKYNRQSGETLYFSVARLQRVAWQSLIALNFIHRRNLMHCDLKPENILIKSYSRSLIKVIDFGSSCFTTDQLSSYVQSRSYRAPEVVLGYPYDQRIDMWSLGCILAELWTGRVLFQNESLATLIAKHIGVIGLQKSDRFYLKQAPLADEIFTADGVLFEKKNANASNAANAPSSAANTSSNSSANSTDFIQIKRTTLKRRLQTSDHLFLSFVSSLLRINPEERPTSWQAMHHPWFRHSYPEP